MATQRPGTAIELAVLFTIEPAIEQHHLDLPSQPPNSTQTATEVDAPFSVVLPDGCSTLGQMEREAIRQAYAYTGKNLTRAAKLIGIARETFRRKLARIADAEEDSSDSPYTNFPSTHAAEKVDEIPRNQ